MKLDAQREELKKIFLENKFSLEYFFKSFPRFMSFADGKNGKEMPMGDIAECFLDATIEDSLISFEESTSSSELLQIYVKCLQQIRAFSPNDKKEAYEKVVQLIFLDTLQNFIEKKPMLEQVKQNLPGYTKKDTNALYALVEALSESLRFVDPENAAQNSDRQKIIVDAVKALILLSVGARYKDDQLLQNMLNAATLKDLSQEFETLIATSPTILEILSSLIGKERLPAFVNIRKIFQAAGVDSIKKEAVALESGGPSSAAIEAVDGPSGVSAPPAEVARPRSDSPPPKLGRGSSFFEETDSGLPARTGSLNAESSKPPK